MLVKVFVKFYRYVQVPQRNRLILRNTPNLSGVFVLHKGVDWPRVPVEDVDLFLGVSQFPHLDQAVLIANEKIVVEWKHKKETAYNVVFFADSVESLNVFSSVEI